MGYVLRFVFAFVLLAATYNPTDWNFLHWTGRADAPLSALALSGLVLAVGYIIYLRATLRSIGPLGVVIVLALVSAILWVLYDFGLVSLDNPNVNTWLAIAALSLVLGVGLSWSHVRRALSGQADMDDVDV